MDGEGPKMGQDADLTITLQNSSTEQRTVTLHSKVSVMYYTGVHKVMVAQDKADVDVLPNESKCKSESPSIFQLDTIYPRYRRDCASAIT